MATSFCSGSSRGRSFKAAKKDGKGSKRTLDSRGASFSQKPSRGGGERNVSEKLEVLRRLISAEGETKADRLFEQTADYIVFLKAQVVILQSLVDFYGKSDIK